MAEHRTAEQQPADLPREARISAATPYSLHDRIECRADGAVGTLDACFASDGSKPDVEKFQVFGPT